MRAMTTVENFIHPAIGRRIFGFACHLKFDDCVLRVRSNSRPLINDLKGYYEEFLTGARHPDIDIIACETRNIRIGVKLRVKSPDPGKNKIKEEFIDLVDGRVVRKRLTGLMFVFNQEWNVAVGTCRKNSNQIVNFINNRYIQWRLNSGCCLLHASAVERGGQGVGLCGFSGMGKSTLALRLMSRGADFVSNDRLMVRKDGQGLKMYGVAKLPRINPGTILNNPDLNTVMSARERKKFSGLPTDELWKVEHKYDVHIHRIYGPQRFVLSSEMKALVILNWRRDGSPFRMRRVDLSERKDLWPAFMKDAGLFYQPDHPNYFTEFATAQAYLDHLKRVKVYELSGGVDFDAAAEKILDLF